MEVIVPAAGLSTRFPNMRPKYSLTDYSGKMMIEKSIEPFIGKYKITIGILKEHEEKYNISQYLKEEYNDQINIIVLDNRTSGPADTVYQIIKKSKMNLDSAIFVKDCDSFFDHNTISGNYICLSKISDHEILKRLASKSFVISNEQGIITSIIEKEVISDKFCVGGYKFDSAHLFCNAFEYLKNKNIKEIFVSHIIEKCLLDGEIFLTSNVTNYVDVGTAEEWFEYNNKAVIFCDIDGTIIKAQPKGGYNSPVEPLEQNISLLLNLQNRGSDIIFTTSRAKKYDDITIKMLNGLGFKNVKLISGLQNTKRILINDFNAANPYPRAIAINLKRDNDNLGDYLHD